MEGSNANTAAREVTNWRTQISPEIRRRAIEFMVGKKMQKVPTCFLEGVSHFQESSTRVEEQTYMVATSEVEYVLRIALMMAHSNSRNGCVLVCQSGNTTQQAPSRNEGQLSEEQSSRNMRQGSIDRISNLPDEMLNTILSSLPALELVRTGMLSSRWRRLWTSVACLYIDVDQFGLHKREQFCKFVKCLLQQRGAAPLVFRLRSAEISDASSWISYAIRNNAEVIEFYEDMEFEPFKLEHGVVDFISFSLKTLVLTNVYLDDVLFNPINFACPALENLEIRESSLEVPEITSGSLLCLVIDNCVLFEDLVIFTTSLVSLCIKTPQYKAPIIKALPSLEVVAIALNECMHSSDGGGDDDEEEEDEEEINHNMLGGVSTAKVIELIAPLREATFDMEMLQCPNFNNLTSLTLGEWCTSDKFSPLLHFLWHAPLLEKLTLKLDMEVCQYCFEDQPMSLPPLQPFMADHLKKVTIHFWLGDDRVSKLLKMLAQISKSLEDIELVPSTTNVRQLVSEVKASLHSRNG